MSSCDFLRLSISAKTVETRLPMTALMIKKNDAASNNKPVLAKILKPIQMIKPLVASVNHRLDFGTLRR